MSRFPVVSRREATWSPFVLFSSGLFRCRCILFGVKREREKAPFHFRVPLSESREQANVVQTF